MEKVKEETLKKVSGRVILEAVADNDIEPGSVIVPTKRVNCISEICTCTNLNTQQIREGLFKQRCNKCGIEWYAEDMEAF